MQFSEKECDSSKRLDGTDDTGRQSVFTSESAKDTAALIGYGSGKQDIYEMSTLGHASGSMSPRGAEYFLDGGGGGKIERHLAIVEDRDEDGIWTWPPGFSPPHSWLRDSHKVNLIHQAEAEFLGPYKMYFQLARQTYFGLDKKTICRYLEATLWLPASNGKSVGERIRDTIDWRIKFPLPVLDKDMLRRELCTGKFFVHGFAKNGSPILYIRPAHENTRDTPNNVKALIYTIERAVQCMPEDTGMDMFCIVDCQGVGMMNTPSMTVIKELVDIMGNHMPRRLGQLFVCNVSSLFYFLWNVISNSLSETTRHKINLLSDSLEEQRRVIGQYVDEKVLLASFGGNNQYEFDVDEYLVQDSFLQDESCRYVYS
eukprot:CAMPEP_0182422434 /NCGR_PEP_ID=MMETSP1167-20130531/8132_1 /TAXON_ID=2988 /ORGANISM="Mallomonas Sp, Strain CCMP3275" /LENGTH=370 /DNA_ID=CAMNT_0024600497 /DNA_START=463 /DNA_END=1575 /DNA_ORIENTATION=+